ncbi:unnamed protein product, partial [Rhizoctonia solani]
MSDPSSFDIHVWNASRPEQATRTRPNTRGPNTFRVSRQDPDPNPSSSSQFMTTTWSPPAPTTPPASSSRVSSLSRSYSDLNSYATTEAAPPSSQVMLLRELEHFSSSEITNALVSLGLSHRAVDAPVQRGGHLPDIHMLSPWPNDRSGQYMRVCGYAYTVKMLPAANGYPSNIAPQVIEAAPMGSIVIVSVPPNMDAAVWDNFMTAHAKNRGVRGAIIGGRTRDLVHHRAAGFPVFAQGHQESSFGQSAYAHPSEANGPIVIYPRTDLDDCFENGFSAVKIHPGDVVVADRDGVACIPPELARRKRVLPTSTRLTTKILTYIPMLTTRFPTGRTLGGLGNPHLGVDRLPPEVLSEIFIICDYLCDTSRNNPKPFACQTVMPSVSCYWRKTALETVALWTRITLSDHAPWRFSELCLERAGPTVLLDINIDITMPFWPEMGDCSPTKWAQIMEKAFAFVIQHGGTTSRWRTFSITTDVFLAHLAAVKFLGKSSFPSLTSLDMTLADDPDEDGIPDALLSMPKPLFCEPPPRLCHAKLQGVPTPYLFGHSTHPQFTALTQLQLRLEGFCPRLRDFNKMLAANLQLESLVLDSETAGGPAQVDDERYPVVHLSSLHSLSFVEVTSPLWTRHTISMLDIPKVTTFGLTLNPLAHEIDHEGDAVRELVDYMIGVDNNQANPAPRFPSLVNLTYSSGLEDISRLREVLPVYPRLKSLTLPPCESLAPLLQNPWLVPDLGLLRIGTSDISGLKEVVSSRCKAGLPFHTVLVEWLTLAEFKRSGLDQLREFVELVLVDEETYATK